MRYIATRPRTEKHEGHGLFGAEPHVDLEKTMQELKTHEGNVWTIIYSLRREDAARLGYDNAESWRLALLAHQNDFAEAMQIPPEHLHWYAAFHDEGEHPHIHMMLWSDDSKYGFLRKDRLLHMQSVLTNTIYADELKEIYIQKDVAYKEVTEAAREVMHDLVDCMESVSEPPASAERIPRDQERDHSGSGASASADGAGTESIRAGNFARGRSSFGRNFSGRFYKSDACKRKYFVHSFSFCGTSVRISSEFNHPPVSPDGTNLPLECCAAQQSNGYPRRFQAPQKAHAKAAGDGP